MPWNPTMTDTFPDPSRTYYSGESHFTSEIASQTRVPVMEILLSVVFVVGIAIIIGLLCKCCCSNSSGGRVIAPPAANTSAGAVPYPQQQYTATFPVVTTYPVASANVGYPTATPYPTASQYPTATPYPTAGAPYPTGGAPYPTGGAPYPTSGASYAAAPSAPDVAALPPSYDQVMGGGSQKQAAYNPHGH